jgi:hypothetical protein
MEAVMALEQAPTRIEQIAAFIYETRGEKVIVVADLAKIYGVPTKRLNEAVRRNIERFPADFMFQLTKDEAVAWQRLRSQFATLKQGQHLKYMPYAFTEHGAVMAATVLNSPQAVQTSLFVVRAFVGMRNMLAAHRDLSRKLEELEKKYDAQFRVVFEAIRQLMTPPEPPRKEIGFHVKERHATYRVGRNGR